MPLKPNFNQPMAEVFGFPITNQKAEAKRHRQHHICPFNNKTVNCTKDKANDPLGVCSVYRGQDVVATCPVRFRENWLIASDAADFFFPAGTNWTTLTEIRLKDAAGGSAGNIDCVLVAYDARGKITDFGALEVQAVYISGNVRDPFELYMKNSACNADMDYREGVNYPRPDFLSSSRKRLAPQLLYKGGILYDWGKKSAVALDKHFFATLPHLAEVPKDQAEIAWLVYDFVPTPAAGKYTMKRERIVYTKFAEALKQITTARAGDVGAFIKQLQSKLDEKLEIPPTLGSPIAFAPPTV
jgi:Restriction endonuclease NotI